MATTTSRRRILDYLQDHLGATASQIGRGLNMRPASVRFHLSLLVRDGRVEPGGAARRRRRGRPETLYRLSEMQRGQNLRAVVLGLLGWLERQPALRKQGAYEAMAIAVIEQIDGGSSGDVGTKRLASLVSKLNVLHYEAAWEAGSKGPRVLFGHCPYAAVIEQHPELCRIDARMLSIELGAGVAQTAKIGAGASGPSHCIFDVG